MLALNSYRLFVYTGICDMRKGFDGLSGVVRNEMAMDPLSGAMFVFSIDAVR
jgi:transposase